MKAKLYLITAFLFCSLISNAQKLSLNDLQILYEMDLVDANACLVLKKWKLLGTDQFDNGISALIYEYTIREGCLARLVLLVTDKQKTGTIIYFTSDDTVYDGIKKSLSQNGYKGGAGEIKNGTIHFQYYNDKVYFLDIDISTNGIAKYTIKLLNLRQ